MVSGTRNAIPTESSIFSCGQRQIRLVDCQGFHLSVPDKEGYLDGRDAIIDEPVGADLEEGSTRFAKSSQGYLTTHVYPYGEPVFRAIFSSGFLTEEQTVLCLEMTDHRNDTSHSYKEAVATIIYNSIKEYANLMEEFLGKIKDGMAS